MADQLNFLVTVKKDKKNGLWKDLKKFKKDFKDYLRYMNYCPMWGATPIRDGNALEVFVKGGKGSGIPYKKVRILPKPYKICSKIMISCL